jgi:hypothetical protein
MTGLSPLSWQIIILAATLWVEGVLWFVLDTRRQEELDFLRRFHRRHRLSCNEPMRRAAP